MSLKRHDKQPSLEIYEVIVEEYVEHNNLQYQKHFQKNALFTFHTRTDVIRNTDRDQDVTVL